MHQIRADAELSHGGWCSSTAAVGGELFDVTSACSLLNAAYAFDHNRPRIKVARINIPFTLLAAESAFSNSVTLSSNYTRLRKKRLSGTHENGNLRQGAG